MLVGTFGVVMMFHSYSYSFNSYINTAIFAMQRVGVQLFQLNCVRSFTVWSVWDLLFFLFIKPLSLKTLSDARMAL